MAKQVPTLENPKYKITKFDALIKSVWVYGANCVKGAIFDGRVFCSRQPQNENNN